MDSDSSPKPVLRPLETAKAAESIVTDITRSPSSATSSSNGDGRRFSFQSFKSRAKRSLSIRDSSFASLTEPRGTGFRAHMRSHSLGTNARKLSKSGRSPSAASSTSLLHRSSGFPDDASDASGPITPSISSSSSTAGIDWHSQRLDHIGPLDPDSPLMITKRPFLAITSDYLVKVKCKADALGLFPSLSGRSSNESITSNPKPLLVIPLSEIVSVFVSESSRPSFGMEVWWRTSSGLSFEDIYFWFKYPDERKDFIHRLSRAVRATQQTDDMGILQPPPKVLELLEAIHKKEEPTFAERKLEVFPVIPRGSLRAKSLKGAEDRSKKEKSPEKPSWYLVFGVYLCYFVVVHHDKSGKIVLDHQRYGLVSLEKVRGSWTAHEERFNATFEKPFHKSTKLELSSRFYRRIIRTFSNADRYLRPAWPHMWQSTELFQVTGLKEFQHIVERDDFGSVRRTLGAYLASYRCPPVSWEINCKTEFSPEFRLLPCKSGKYTALQFMAVFRALRYNDYFNSLSFRDVDMSGIWGLVERTPHVAATPRGLLGYMTRTCITLHPSEIQVLMHSSILHQEIHSLAFCSETVQQIDLTRCAAFLDEDCDANKTKKLEFLTPVLSLLRSGITRCSNLLLGGNWLQQGDIEDLVDTLYAAKIQSLDISSCRLHDVDFLTLAEPIIHQRQPLRSFNISENPGRLPAHLIPSFCSNLTELKNLDLGACVTQDKAGWETLLPVDVLMKFHNLECLDISQFIANPATLCDIADYLDHTNHWDGDVPKKQLRKLTMNSCSLSGDTVSKFCRGDSKNYILSITDNPLTDGIDALANAIRNNQVPTGLIMDMVFFKKEDDFVRLFEALTETRAVYFLSIVGISVSTDPEKGCSDRFLQTLENFFAHNESIQFLDISGYTGRLEDGQLPAGFGRSLRGLLKNKTLTHLKIRNQNLEEDDLLTLGRVLAENPTIRVLDCQENNFTFNSTSFLIHAVKSNERIVDLPFTAGQRTNISRAIWKQMHKRFQMTGKTKINEDEITGLVTTQFAELDDALRHNRTSMRRETGKLLDHESPSGTTLEDMLKTWLAVAPNFDGDVEMLDDSQPNLGRATVRSSQIGLEGMMLPVSYTVEHGESLESPRRSSQTGLEIMLPETGHITHSPTETTFDMVSEASTPHEALTPIYGEDEEGGLVEADRFMEKLVKEFGKTEMIAAQNDGHTGGVGCE